MRTRSILWSIHRVVLPQILVRFSETHRPRHHGLRRRLSGSRRLFDGVNTPARCGVRFGVILISVIMRSIHGWHRPRL